MVLMPEDRFLPSKLFHLQPGTVVGIYEILGVIGQGGFSLTYLGNDNSLEAEVVIKEYFPNALAQRAADGATVIPSEETNYLKGLQFFYQEAQVLSQFQSPNIVDVRSVFRANDTAYLVMPYYRGKNLEVWLEDRGEPLQGEEAFRLLGPVLDALDYIHDQNVIHRDVKPENILVAESGKQTFPLLLDFGGARQYIAGVTQTFDQVLTPGYAPLEQYSAQGNQGPWTDVYASGALLYRMVIGERPPDATARRGGHPLDLDGLKPNLGAVVDKAMAEAPEQRYQQVGDFKIALQEALEKAEEEPDNGKRNGGPPLWPFAFLVIAVAAVAGWLFLRNPTREACSAPELQQLVSRSRSGTTITLCKITFDLTGTLEIDKPLTLQGEDVNTTILRSSSGVPIIRFSGDGILTITGLTLLRQGTAAANALEVEQGHLDISNSQIANAIRAETGHGGRGILIQDNVQSVTVSGVAFVENEIGLEASGTTELSIQQSIFHNNGTGLISAGDTNGTILDSQFQGNQRGLEVKDRSQLSLLTQDAAKRFERNTWAIQISGTATIEATGIQLVSNGTGISARGESSLSLQGAAISGSAEAGIQFMQQARGRIDGNTFSQNSVGIFCTGGLVDIGSVNSFNENGENRRGC